MIDSTVHASIISVAGDWARVVFEASKPSSDLTRKQAVSLLRRNFESTYKEILVAVEILEKEKK
ncbi:MAG: hypothetical protein FJ025_03910 [Chloroflexi bacterium]|nr:hypothetical protein [Chloroflexota bacterium]